MIRVALVLALLAPLTAHAADRPYCLLWAREQTRVDFARATDVDSRTSDKAAIEGALVKNWQLCLSMETRPLLEGSLEARTAAWVASVYTLQLARFADEGTLPATEPVAEADWKDRCRADYRTWDDGTETVIRRGSKGRVPCPYAP